MAKTIPFSFPSIQTCSSHNRKTHTVITNLNGTLLRSSSSFPYFALAAFDIGGPLRLLFLLLLSPLYAFLHHFVSESAGLQVLIFASLAGARISTIESVARAVLPKFYSEDLHPETWRVLSACDRRCVVTENLTVMVEPFLKEYLGIHEVVGTKIGVYRGKATGFVGDGGVLIRDRKVESIRSVFGGDFMPEIGIGERKESYLVPHQPNLLAVSPAELPKPIIFHNGRLVQKPTPLVCFLTILYLFFTIFLSILRLNVSCLLPIPLSLPTLRYLGVRIIIHGTPCSPCNSSTSILFVLTHRTLIDPVALSFSFRRRIKPSPTLFPASPNTSPQSTSPVSLASAPLMLP